MKKISIILVMLFWCNVSFAGECIEGDCNNGRGTMNHDGMIVTADFKNGELIPTQKNVKIKWPEEDKYELDSYEGGWKNGEFHGRGVVKASNGTVVSGGWKKGKSHGIVTTTWPDGDVYVGKFKKGELIEVISMDKSKSEKAKKKLELASMVEDAKKTCKDLGFTEGTDKFSDCSLKLYTLSVESAAKNNQTVVMQPQSSGSNSVTIYDPVRDSNALIRQGQRMLSGACTLGINC